MYDIKPALEPRSPGARAAVAVGADLNPEAMAKHFFILTMLGLVAYVSAILLLLSGSN